MLLGATAASGEMLRLVDGLGAAPLAYWSDGAPSSSRGGAIAGRSFGGEELRWREVVVVSVKQKSQVSIQVSLSSAPAPTSSRGKRGLVVKPPRALQANVATIVTESIVCTDVAIDEALALARAAAKAARDAARDAAAYAEAQASADDSEQVFPSQQDLLLLERARLTEMARSGAVQLTTSPDATVDDTASTLWNELGSSTSEVDLDLEAANLGTGSRYFELEQDLHSVPDTDQSATERFQQLQDDDELQNEQLEASHESQTRRLADITVRSSRRRERILKRERALVRADLNAASPPTGQLAKAKKANLTYDATDPVRGYLQNIGKAKLLTAAEEIGLAEGIQDLLRMESVRADLLEQMGRDPSLLEWAEAIGIEHTSLESRIKSGQACKDKMVKSNLRLVVSIAKRYQGRGMTIQDLIQEGSMGLIRGAEKFDHTRGFKFSTYAHWWIRQAITRAIADQSRTVRLPVHVYELLSRINKAKSMLSAEHGRVPREEEVAELVGLTIEKLQMVIKAAKNPKSLEFPVGKNNDTMLGEIIADKDFDSPEEAINKRLLKQDLNAVLNTLNPRERDVLKLRYGLVDGRMRTLEDIGNVFSVTRERIRQIEAKALRKLRHPSRNAALRDYLELKS